MDRKTIITALGGLVLLILIAGAWSMNKNDANNNQNQVEQEQTPELLLTTKIYSSDKLGITFTYNPRPADTFEVTVTEIGSKIYVHGTEEKPEQGKMIEVFTKDANISLAEAIKRQFLANRSETDCFVETITQDPTDPRPDSYVFAEISYPPPANDNQPFWQNSSKCPQVYSKTNAVQYFMMNQDVPGKFVFVQLGQDSITDDGTAPLSDGSRRDWSASIRIIK